MVSRLQTHDERRDHPGRPDRDEPGAEVSTTVSEAIATFEKSGYQHQFVPRLDGIQCVSCHTTSRADLFAAHSVSRIEGTSDPADEAMVVATECPHCNALGTTTIMYGPEAQLEDVRASGRFVDERDLNLRPLAK